MKKISFILCLLLLSSASFSEHHKDHHKGLGAHEHGSIELDVAVEGKVIEIEIDGPAESFLGFEYAPKTDKEKKVLKDAEDLWTKDLLTKLFVLDQKLGCTSSEVKFEQEMDEHHNDHHDDHKDHKKDAKKETGVHSDIEAKAKITCAQDLKGQTLVVNVKKHFPKIKKLSIDLVATETKKIDAKSSQELKL